jgi:NADPH:quinone reductase-like Zn-dependent oxidoreductase
LFDLPDAANMHAMKSIVQRSYGSDADAVLQLAEVDRPTIGEDEILVRVRAASVDRGTWHIMTGLPYLIRLVGFGLRAPKAANPGRSFAGTVDAIGKGVTELSPGDEVYGSCAGSFAEFARVGLPMVARKPSNLSFEQTATMPVSAVAALQALRDCAKVQAGQSVVIVGASGGVGTFAVQIAKALDAEVTGVCSTAKIELVSALGADNIVDYTREDFADGKHRYDVILDIGGNRRLSHLRRALAPKGTLVIVGGETGGRWLGGFDRQLRALVLSRFVSQKLTMLTSKENATDLRFLAELCESGKILPAVDRTYTLSEVPVAIRYVAEGRTQGKVVITL